MQSAIAERTSEGQEGPHQRVRICEECEELECATWCLNCEQFLCMPCDTRLHKKGARQKHKRQAANLSPEIIKPSHTKSVGDSSVGPHGKGVASVESDGGQDGGGGGSESSRKHSTDTDYYFTDKNHLTSQEREITLKREKLHLNTSLGNQRQQAYYANSNNEYSHRNQNFTNTNGGGRVSQYLPLGSSKSSGKSTNGGGTHQKANKGSSSYSSGGSSSGGSYQNTHGNSGQRYQNYDQQQYYGGSSQYLSGNRQHNKYKKITSSGGGGNNYSSSGIFNNGQTNNQPQDSIPPQFFGNSNNTKLIVCIDGEQVVIPIWQPLVKCEKSNQEMLTIQKELFRLASKGDLLIENDLLIQNLIEKLNIQENQCLKLIDQAEQQGIIHQTKRNFAKMKTLSFVSLQLDIISHECLGWVLASLKKDEMTPSERAIQSRIKEAFAFKISSPLWDCIIESIQKKSDETDRQTTGPDSSSNKQHRHISLKAGSFGKNGSGGYTYNDYYNVQKFNSRSNQNLGSDIGNSLRNNYVYQEDNNKDQELCQYEVKEIEDDPSTGQMTKAIYRKGEKEWIGVDQNTDEVDFNLYEELKSFLHDYFCAPQESQYDDEEEKWCSSIENALTRTNIGTNNQKIHGQGFSEIDFDEVRAIPGGRYGCAQFVKICGPQILKQCSLGKLAQLVQFAVKEDVLRYHKTLLVWTTTVDKHKKMAEELQKESHQKAAIAAKLTVVKNALIEILAESKSGMSLAQLPLYLRRKLPFSLDLNELGFPKLKDLILSMSDKIKLELRGHNHPFAYLVKSGRYVHSSSNSDDFQNIPKSKDFIKTTNPHLSEDVNISRHLKNALALNEGNIKNVLTAFFNLMREFPLGLRSDQLPKILSIKLGQEFNFKNFGCHSLLEFIKKFVIPTMDIEIFSNGPMENESFIIRSKEFFKNYHQELAKQQQVSNLQQINTNQSSIKDQMSTRNVATDDQMQQNESQLISHLKQMNRQDSASSSLNLSSQCYIPNHQSLYGGSTSANTSAQINISHIRVNTADTAEIHSVMPKNEIHQSIVTVNPFTKPPLAPMPQDRQNFQNNNQQSAPQNLNTQQNQQLYQQKSNSYKTFPPIQIQPQYYQINQQQQTMQQVKGKNQIPQSNSTSFSMQSLGGVGLQSNQPHQYNFRQGFFLSPGQLQLNKMGDQFSYYQHNSPPQHSRAISFNNSAFNGAGGMQSTTSKSASQDFSLQSSIIPGKVVQSVNASGTNTPQLAPLHFMGSNNFNYPSRSYFPNQGVDSIFGSPIQLNYQFDTNSIHQTNYNIESSPPFDQEDDDPEHNMNIKRLIDNLVCDDEIDYKSCDEQSNPSTMHSPQLSAVSGLRVPQSNFQGYGPGINMHNYNKQHQKKNAWVIDFKRPTGSLGSQSSRGLGSSSSQKNIGGVIMEGGSSSSDENKRPSTVHEQKTEEDAEDTSISILNSKWSHLMNNVQDKDDQWSNDMKLFQ